MNELPRIVAPPPGPRSRALAARLSAVESPAFDARREARAEASGEDQSPIVYASGHGSNVVDVDGNRYVDLTAGFGALVLGHVPPPPEPLVLALGDVYASETKVRACEAIAALFPGPARVMLGLSGADAVTCALKTAMLATGKPGVLAFDGSYHGLSYGPLAACGLAPAFREPFAAQLGVPVTFAPYGSLEAARTADVGAILVEPLLGRGGCVTPPDGFLEGLRAIADERGILLVVDEIWTGMGRTGAMLASPVKPDLLCLGKGLGGGVPISACVGREDVMAAWGGHGGTRIHTGTHFGSPPACAAALATIAAVEPLLPEVREKGERWRDELSRVCRVSGRGLMVGLDLETPARALGAMRALLARGYIVLTGGKKGATLTLSPPLTIAPELLTAFVEALRASLERP